MGIRQSTKRHIVRAFKKALLAKKPGESTARRAFYLPPTGGPDGKSVILLFIDKFDRAVYFLLRLTRLGSTTRPGWNRRSSLESTLYRVDDFYAVEIDGTTI